MPDMPRTLTTVEVKHLRTLAINSLADLVEIEGGVDRSCGEMFWKSKGFVQLLDFEKAVLQIRQGNGLVLPDTEVSFSSLKFDSTLFTILSRLGAII